MAIINNQTGSDHDIDKVNLLEEKVVFQEELLDLFIGDFIDKHRFLSLRKLFKTKEKEFAIRVVKELHSENI
tara:strand:+ start:81 stop:296 length:216 start_codon:yes stop_codon:yes gene_type:complete